MEIDELKKRIKDNDLSGVFLFCGKENFMKDHYASILRKKVDQSPLPEFNHIYFNASSDKLSDLEDAFDSLPYMWETKIIEITDIENANFNDSDLETYERIFSDVPDYLTVLIVLRSDDSDDSAGEKTKKKTGIAAFIGVVKKCGYVVEFEPEKADKLIGWIHKHFASEGVAFNPNVPAEMINYCGSDMYILEGEIKKLSAAFDGAPLTVSDVHKYCCENTAYKYFDIASALNRRDILGAKRIYEGLELKKSDVPAALGYIIKTYSDMLLVKTGMDGGKGYDVIAKDLKLPSWRVGKIAQSVSSSTTRSLSFAINCLSTADTHIKSMNGDPKRILELAFYRICAYGR